MVRYTTTTRLLLLLVALGCDASPKQPSGHQVIATHTKKIPEETDQHLVWQRLIRRLPFVTLPYEHVAWSEEGPAFDLIELTDEEWSLFNPEFSGPAVGLLPDTSQFFHLLWIFEQDDLYPVLTTFDKAGRKISEGGLNSGLCGETHAPCYRCYGVFRISADLTFSNVDSIRSCACDTSNQLIPGTCEFFFSRSESRIGADGKLTQSAPLQSNLPVQ